MQKELTEIEIENKSKEYMYNNNELTSTKYRRELSAKVLHSMLYMGYLSMSVKDGFIRFST